ncbi:unnamed protein product [Mytilus coruscus]|uniref:Uncharacterized protein n=1 Tax=Mytilus coruscus TaxID=42192 RepID=A0A6J8AB14_MYTCO|nr:unnamed protein product [Mytilus coruscus]
MNRGEDSEDEIECRSISPLSGSSRASTPEILLPSQVRFQGDSLYQTSQFNEIKIQVDKMTSQVNFNTKNIQMLKTDIGNLDNKMEYQMTHIDNRLHSNEQNMKRQLENHEETIKRHLDSNNNLLNNIETILTRRFGIESEQENSPKSLVRTHINSPSVTNGPTSLTIIPDGSNYNPVISQPNLPRTSTLYGPENSPAVQPTSTSNTSAFVPITIPIQVPHTL